MSKHKLTPDELAAYRALAKAARRLRKAQVRAGRKSITRQKQGEAPPCRK